VDSLLGRRSGNKDYFSSVSSSHILSTGLSAPVMRFSLSSLLSQKGKHRHFLPLGWALFCQSVVAITSAVELIVAGVERIV